MEVSRQPVARYRSPSRSVARSIATSRANSTLDGSWAAAPQRIG
jgi:hypothetical protein